MAFPVAQSQTGFSFTLQHETVNDKVNYSPNLTGGGFAPAEQRPRFQSNGIGFSYRPDNAVRYQFEAARHEMTSLRDSFVMESVSAGVSRQIQQVFGLRHSADIGVNLRVNSADEIYKNSYTAHADLLITEVRLIQPLDLRLSVHSDLTIALKDRVGVTLGFETGLTQTDQKEVTGLVRLSNDCHYAFNASTRGGTVRQVERCGRVISYQKQYPSDRTLNDDIGFSVAEDITYRDYFFGPRLSLQWRLGYWRLNTGYQYRKYVRPALDDRMRSLGISPVNHSQDAFVTLGYSGFRKWQATARINYQKAAFLNDIPFLYNAFTHGRFRGNGVIRYGFSVTRLFD